MSSPKAGEAGSGEKIISIFNEIYAIFFAKHTRVTPSAIRKLVPVSCSVDVGFASLAPEDGPDLLLRALGIGVGLEGQRLGGASLPQSQALQDSRGGHLPVQSVNMDTCQVEGGVT